MKTEPPQDPPPNAFDETERLRAKSEAWFQNCLASGEVTGFLPEEKPAKETNE